MEPNQPIEPEQPMEPEQPIEPANWLTYFITDDGTVSYMVPVYVVLTMQTLLFFFC